MTLVKITGSLFVISFFLGFYLLDNKEWRDFGTNLMLLTGVLFVLSMIWNLP